ncbi:pseudaminic acid synthase [Blastopirellula marina]|uniref:Pseudaminic acid synthase n=1 Tax=Blastopirellula marina TaxID=124 RepID=A0A2S8G2Y8_9BACT|nr:MULTISPECIES: pseudaminic acid synthase [Pirellulaceae]PQO38793.1 pseudaminic acid synthase [Blastopirellula marina]RCS55101.1 pseudaminic acid synthase [Bremerella cremea]
MNDFKILGREIGHFAPTYVIAELSANHHQSIERAKELVHTAKDAGADAIKLQTYTADTITIHSSNKPFQISGGTIWDGKTLYDLYQEAYTPWEWQPELKAYANDLGMDCFSSPFDPTSVAFLEKMEVPCYKIASFEIVDTGLLREIGRTGKPVIMSTGMATLGEIDEAISTLRGAGAGPIALLKCTSSYPSPPEEMNLRTIPHMASAFGVPVGLSDHTLGIAVPVAAVALGACIIEKHLTLSRDEPGPDSAFSLEPDEFKAMVEAVRTTEKAMGQINYSPTSREQASRTFRRSLFVTQDIKAGESFTPDNVRSIRPGNGLEPKWLDVVLESRATTDLKRGTPLELAHLAQTTSAYNS